MRIFKLLLFLSSVEAVLAAAPSISAVVNAASYSAGSLAPGSLATIFGSSLASATAAAPGFPLPSALGSTTVYVNDLPAPLLYVSPGQINFQVPWQAEPGPSSVLVISGSDISNFVGLQIASTAPGLFTGVLSSAWGNPPRPVHAGEYITIYGTGLGPVDNPPPSGAALPDYGLAPLQTTPTVTVGGVAATVAFAGLAPPGQNQYSAGVYQINALVPPNASAGASVPVVVSAGGVLSNAVTVSIASGAGTSIAKYLELGPGGAVVARAIASENVCPAIVIDGASQTMQTRAAPTLPFYPVLSCEAAIPKGTQSLSIEGQSLAMPVDNPQRVTVLGDTGCRMDTTTSQACYDPKAWPLAAVGVSAMASNPQLLIHNGDYHYREASCFSTVPGCAGSPWGYNWDVWREDVFKPLQNLLAAAPWVFTRGNHESCDRAGEGWFRFLDPRPMPAECQIYTDPYSILIGSLQLLELDSNVADDAVLYPDQIAAYQQQFAALQQLAGSNAWILTHRPIWGVRSNLNANVVLQAASQNTLPAGVKLILSGHTHTFETFDFSPARSPQLVIGNSGDNLASQPTTLPAAGMLIGNASVVDNTSIGGFGFSTMTPSSDGSWTIVSRDSGGNTNTTCTFHSTTITCSK
ncbi:MAG: metallophosphoesterase [Acidobacteriia bacterium]|nr:metallophosphoesterase [Terriglobia bacterium]